MKHRELPLSQFPVFLLAVLCPVSVLVSVFVIGAIPGKKEESLKPVRVLGFFVELLTRFELVTSSLPRMRSTY